MVKNPPADTGDAGDMISIPGLGRSPGGGNEWQPIPVFFPGKSHGQRSLAGYSPRGHKESNSTTQLSTRTGHIQTMFPSFTLPSEFGFHACCFDFKTLSWQYGILLYL